MVMVAPSVLSADFANLSRDVERAKAGGADYLHFDVMDGLFVPNISVGPVVLEDLNRATDLPLDVHLMIHEPERYLEVFRNAGADIISVHAESSTHLHRNLQAIRGLGARAGVSLNPATSLSVLENVMPFADLILIMTVNPGFGGQAFIAEMLPKISAARRMIDECDGDVIVEVDGGIGPDNVSDVVRAGADMVVAGSAVFGKSGDGDVEANIRNIRSAAEAAETDPSVA